MKNRVDRHHSVERIAREWNRFVAVGLLQLDQRVEAARDDAGTRRRESGGAYVDANCLASDSADDKSQRTPWTTSKVEQAAGSR
jgi:hypothetical protein